MSVIVSNVHATEDYVKQKIILGARRSGWQVCDAQNRSLELYRDYKDWFVLLKAPYSWKGYALEVDTKRTTLKNEDGEVHRAVNKLMQKAARTIDAASPGPESDARAREPIPTCREVSKMSARSR